LRSLSIFAYPVLREVGALRLFVHHEILVPVELVDEPVDLVVLVRRLLCRTGYDKGGSRLVNEDAVHLVDNGIVELLWENSSMEYFMLSLR